MEYGLRMERRDPGYLPESLAHAHRAIVITLRQLPGVDHSLRSKAFHQKVGQATDYRVGDGSGY